MRYYANPSTPAAREAMTRGDLGCITTPNQGSSIPPAAWFCADNSAFGDNYPGDAAWWQWLTGLDRQRCVFAVAPDRVGDAAGTDARSRPWLAKIRSLGIWAAFAAQNGLTPGAVPWDEFDVLFIGGIVECPQHGPRLDAVKHGSGVHQRFFCPICRVRIFDWKIGRDAWTLAAAARSHGKLVHMGRVNSELRLRYAAAIGCDSADGTFLTFGPDKNLPQLLGWLRSVNGQHRLFEVQ